MSVAGRRLRGRAVPDEHPRHRDRVGVGAEALAVVALALVVAVGIMLVFGEETARRGLEDVAELAAAPRVT